MDFPIPPEFWWSTDNLSASIFRQGVDQKILPCGQGRIDSVKINPSLLMMRDCIVLCHNLFPPFSSKTTLFGHKVHKGFPTDGMFSHLCVRTFFKIQELYKSAAIIKTLPEAQRTQKLTP